MSFSLCIQFPVHISLCECIQQMLGPDTHDNAPRFQSRAGPRQGKCLSCTDTLRALHRLSLNSQDIRRIEVFQRLQPAAAACLQHGRRRASAVIRLVHRHHGRSVFLIVIPFGKAASRIEVCERRHIRRVNRVSFPSSFKVQIDILAVDRRHSCRILRALHPPFDFQRGDAGIDEVRQNLQRADILETQ